MIYNFFLQNYKNIQEFEKPEKESKGKLVEEVIY